MYDTVNTAIHYRLHGARSTVVTITSKVNRETGILTPVDLKPLKILLQKLDILIASWGATGTPIFMGIDPTHRIAQM